MCTTRAARWSPKAPRPRCWAARHALGLLLPYLEPAQCAHLAWSAGAYGAAAHPAPALDDGE